MNLDELPDILRIRQVGELLGYGRRFDHQRLEDLGIPHIQARPHHPDEANSVRGVRIPKIALIEWLRTR